MKIILTRGLPASGKSTWAKQYIKDNPNWKRVNKDDLREMIDAGKWSSKNESMVLQIRDELIKKFLSEGFSVIVDDTNFNPVHIIKLSAIASSFNAGFEVKDFTTSLEECIERDAKRPNGVGEEVIRAMHDKYIRTKVLYNEDKKLPHAFIFDIDGTLATKCDRDIFDYSKVSGDYCIEPVANMLRRLEKQDYFIICCSGRDDNCKDETQAWLTKNRLHNDMLLMRETGDKRKDSIVKRELFEEHIRGKYYVEAVFDDRQQVVDMWRDMGLFVFQVADGKF